MSTLFRSRFCPTGRATRRPTGRGAGRPAIACDDRARARRRAGLALAAAAALLAGCGKSEPQAEPLVSVQAAAATRRPMVEWVTSEAVIHPIQQAVLTPKISAPVARFFVNRGDRVRAGELVARLENKDLAAAAMQSQGAYEQALANYQTEVQATVPLATQKAQLDLASAEQALDAARRAYQSQQELYAQGALPRRTLDASHVAYAQAETNYKLARQQAQALERGGEQRALRAAAGQLAAARGQAQAAEAQLGYSEIRSPIAGVVASRPAYPGELASPNTPLMTIMNISRVTARAHLPPAQAARVRAGDAARITRDGGAPIPARVTVVSPAADPNSTTIEVWAEAANGARALRPGETVSLRIRAGVLADALVVPSDAILTASDGSTSVMVVGRDGKAHARAVTVGAAANGETQIVQGLAAGERVVTVGAFGLTDGTPIRVVPAPAG